MRATADADVDPPMRTFSCFIVDARRGERAQSLVLAQSDERACELARRELLRTPEGVSAEVVEGGRVIAILRREDAEPLFGTPNPRFRPAPAVSLHGGLAPLHAAILRALSGGGRSRRNRRRA